MGAAILLLFILPYAPRHHYKLGTTFSSLQKLFLWIFACNFCFLLYLGGKPAAQPYIYCSQIATFIYFTYVVGIGLFLP